VLKHHCRFILDVLIQENAVVGFAQQFRQFDFARFDWLASQVAAVKLDEIECIQEYGSIIPAVTEHVEIGKAILVAIDRFAIKQK